jgi:hypothetical protein
MYSKTGSRPTGRHVLIFESELCLIAGNALAWGALETGGELLGLRSNGDRSVILLVTPPAQGAIHQSAHFAQNMAHFQGVLRFMTTRYGIQYRGDWHSHAMLHMDHPSSGDVRSMKSLREKNNMPHLIQIILTHSSSGEHRDSATSRNFPLPFSQSKLGTKRPTSHIAPAASSEPHQIKASAYIYTPDDPFDYSPCQLRVIPGVSPFRLALEQEAACPASMFRFLTPPLPLSAIQYDTFDATRDALETPNEIPNCLMKQLSVLSEELQETAEFAMHDGMLFLALELSSSMKLRIGYRQKRPSEVLCVYLHQPMHDRLEDISEQMLDGALTRTVSVLYKRAFKVLKEGNVLASGDSPEPQQAGKSFPEKSEPRKDMEERKLA